MQIRNASGVIITQIVLLSGLEMWPELMPALMELLKSNNKDYIITALSCLSKMMEDNIYEFDTAAVHYPLNELIPMFLSFFEYPDEEVVYHSVNCMRFTIESMPNALLTNMDTYLRVGPESCHNAQGLSWLLTRASDDTLALICNSLVSILGVRVDALSSCLTDVFGFMLQMSQHHNAFVATQATGATSFCRLSGRILECFCHAGRGRDPSGPVESFPTAADSSAVEGWFILTVLPAEYAIF